MSAELLPIYVDREAELDAIARQLTAHPEPPELVWEGRPFDSEPAPENVQHELADRMAAQLGGPLLLTISAAEVLRDDTPSPKYLVDGLVPSDGVTIIGGDPKSMKTLLATQLAIEVGAGAGEGSLFGRTCGRGPVLFVEEEGSRHRLRERLAMMVTGMGRADPPGIAFALHQGVLLDDPASIAIVARTAELLNPVLIVWDPLVALHRADENTAAMARVLKPLVDLSAALGCANVVLHHLSKPSPDRRPTGKAGRYRGSGAIRGVSDANLTLEREGDYLVHVFGEFRDADPLELTLELDPMTLLLHPVVTIAAVSGRPEVVTFVRQHGQVTALEVARQFGKAKNTARAWLELEPEIDVIKDPAAGDRYFVQGAH